MEPKLIRRWLLVAVILLAALAAADPAGAQLCILDPLSGEATCL